MANDESPAAGSSRGSADGRPSDDTLVAQPTNQAGPLPKKQGELGWTPPADDAAAAADQTTAETGLPGPHPAERAPSPNPSPNPTPDANASSTSLGSQSQCSIFKQFLRKPRALPKINGIRSATIFRVSLLSLTLIATIIGWVITATRMNAWNAHANSAPIVPVDHPSPDGANSTAPPAAPSQQQMSQMADSSLAFAHVAFGAAVLFQLLMLERAVYRLRAERYAFLHPDEVLAASTGGASGIMGLAPWNRPPLPTYAAALGVRGTGDVEDAIIAAPPPPEYGNTRGSTLLLSAAILNRSASSSSSSQRNPASGSRPPSQGTVRDALGRPMGEWSRPVSYGEDELRQDARRSLDLEAALSRLEGQETREVGDGWVHVTRPENAALRA